MKCWGLRPSLSAVIESVAALAVGGAGEHRVDRRRDELDVAELLGRDVGDQVVERPGVLAIAEVERLERVVHERGHLAEAPPMQLLDEPRPAGSGSEGGGSSAA